MRILKQNFEALGTVVGGTLINVFKPIVSALNVVIGKFIQFAKVVSESLGKIFGWEYQESGVSGVTNEMEDAADASTGVADGLNNANKNAKKLRQQLQGFDELNVLSSDKDSSTPNNSNTGASGTSGTGDASSGKWEKTESIFKEYESSLDNLYKLGEYIGTTLTNALNNINWNKVYEGARNFGTGLASFLNGLISPDLFGALGKTIAGSINTALNAANAFAIEFEWDELGESIAESINEFFLNFDFPLLAQTISNWGHGLLTTIKDLIANVKWYEIGQKLGEFVQNIEWLTIIEDAIEISMETVESLTEFFQGYFDGIKWEEIKEDMKLAVENIKWSEVLGEIVDGLFDIKNLGDILNFETIFPWWNETNLAFKLLEAIRGVDWEEIKATIKEKMEELKFKVSVIVENILEKIKEKWELAKDWWNDKREKLSSVSATITSIKDNLKEKWENARKWWKNKKEKLTNVSANISSIKDNLEGKWKSAKSYWKKKGSLSSISVVVSSIKDKLKSAWESARKWWKNNKPSLSEITAKIKLPRLVVTWDTSTTAAKALQKLGLKGFPNFSVKYYAMGGFPEDGWFRANHGELMGKFDNGRTVVANNKQITQGIADAVYQGNRENNALLRQELELMRRQNNLLSDILEKETGISAGELFSSVRQSANDYKRRTGRPAFSY